MSKLNLALLAQLRGFLGHREARNIVTRSGARVRGIYFSARFRRGLKWESRLERRLIKACDVSWLVRDALTQPITWTIPDGDGSFEYTPDAAILTRCGQVAIVECKPEIDLQDPETRRRLNRVAEVLAASEIQLSVLTEEYLSDALNTNCETVLRYQRWRGTAGDREDLRHQVLSMSEDLCLAKLSSHVGLPQAFHAIASQWVSVDWHVAIDGSSFVKTAHHHNEESWDAMRCLHPW